MIPEMVRLAKSNMLLRARRGSRLQDIYRIIQKRVRSVPEVGIQVGCFHTFERFATLVFVDYVLRNIVGLLVMHSEN